MNGKLTPKRRKQILERLRAEAAKTQRGYRPPIITEEDIIMAAIEEDRYGPKPVKVHRTLFGVQVAATLKERLQQALKQRKEPRLTKLVDDLLEAALAQPFVDGPAPRVATTQLGLYLHPDHLAKINALIKEGRSRRLVVERLLTTALDQQK